MSVTNPTNNETRVENIGDANVAFEKIGNQWMVSSLEIHRVFKAGMTTSHGHMVRDMKSKSEYYWNTFIDGEEILPTSYADKSSRVQDSYYFNRPAMSFYITSMTGRKADKFKLAFIRKFEELEKMVARVARGEVNLSIEASELINNMVDSDDVITMGVFSQYINKTRKGTNISNQKIYQLLRDMEFVTKNENRNTIKGSIYLTTVVNMGHNTPSIRVYDDLAPSLLNKMVEFVDRNDHPFKECMGISKSSDLASVVKFESFPTEEEPIFKASEQNKIEYMDVLGLKQQYTNVTKATAKYNRTLAVKASEYIEENKLKYETTIDVPSNFPKDATLTIEDGKCTGYSIKVPGGTLTWDE